MRLSFLARISSVSFLFSVLFFVSCSKDSQILNENDTTDSEQSSDENDSEKEDGNDTPPVTISSFLTVADFELPAQNADGFTILSPSEGSQVIYVDSETGDDATAQIYAANDAAIGDDIFNPTNSIKPFLTIAAAYENMREDEPDVMLLASGGIWNESLQVTRGKSSSERSIYGSYGQGNRPELRTGPERGIGTSQMSNVIISNIKFWAHTRDDQGNYFEGFEGSSGFSLFTRDNRFVSNVLIEDCFFRAYKGNVLTGNSTEGRNAMDKIVLRRNIISGNYSTDSHSQGLFYNGIGDSGGTAILLEENIFDHNGWRVQRYASTEGMQADDGQATFFNHNTYFANAKGVLFYGNIFLRPSSMGNKWTANEGEGSSTDLAMVDNLYIDGEIGIGIGGNKPGPRRFKNILISNNVMLDVGKSRPTNRTLAWYLEVQDWDGGEVKENLFLHERSEEVGNVFAMNFTAATAMHDVSVNDNITYGLSGGTGNGSGLLRFSEEGTTSNINFNGNYFHNTSDSPLVSYEGQDGYTFIKNYYYGTREDGWFGLANEGLDFDAWKTQFETDAETFETGFWSNPERDIESYMSATGKGGSMNDFIEQLYGQSRGNWDAALSAPYINQWIREGFGR